MPEIAAFFGAHANLLVLGTYLALTLALGLYLSRYVRRDEDFFLAGRSLNKWVVVGTLLGEALRPTGEGRRRRVAALFERMSPPRPVRRPAIGWVAAAWALASLTAFVACALGEQWLPKPANILVFLGLMMSFVFGCYLAIPLFVTDAPEPQRLSEPGSIERSWVNRIVSSGWTWLAVYAAAAALMLVLYYT